VSEERRRRQAERRAEAAGESPRRAGFRAAEAVLWLAVVALMGWRFAPEARAALGWDSGAVSAPSVTFDMLGGGQLPLQQLKGQVVLVNFWATWCPPCRAEMPGFQQLYEAKHGDGFTVVGVAMDEAPPSTVASFVADHAITYPVALATQGSVAPFGDIESFPTSYLIDRYGRIRYTVQGIFAGVALRAAVDRLLAEHS